MASDFTVKPVGFKVYYDGAELSSDSVELSFCESNETNAAFFSVYEKEGTLERWLCDCTDSETAESVALGLQLVALVREHKEE